MKNTMIKKLILLATSLGMILAGTAQAGNDYITNDSTHPVPITGTIAANSTAQGAANYANGQVTATGTAGTLLAARTTRRSAVFVNTDTSITVYIGKATVTSANGLPLKAGQSISIDSNQLIQVISASGSPVVAYMETYD